MRNFLPASGNRALLSQALFTQRFSTMKTLHFEIRYHTNWGESLEIFYSIDGARTERASLFTDDGELWQTALQTADSARHIRYAYQVSDESGNPVRIEPNNWRLFHFNHRTEVVFCDAWAERSLDTLYHRTAFSQCIMLPRGGDRLHLDHLSAPCLLMLHALPPADGLKWAVVGDGKNWGEWDARNARPLQRSGTYEWSLPLTRLDFLQGVFYKYVLIDPLNPSHVLWEEGGNRQIKAGHIPATASVVRQDELPRIELPAWKGTGCVIPVFSLRSKGSFGIGDFGDLRQFVRWAADTNLKAVQLLPINDTTRNGSWRDSYPYNGISVFALHPIYLDPREWKDTQAYARHLPKAAPLNELPELNYEAAFRLKTDFTRDLFVEIGRQVTKSKDFRAFANGQAQWLNPYARFCAFRDHFGTANFRSWPHKAGSDEIAAPDLSAQQLYYQFVQYLLHRQMEAVHAEARERGVLLKGDIPIGISPDSVPAWADGRLFHFDGQAGAPPDDFAVNGQNWGFPTYNWEEMAKDGYRWWRSRLHHMEHYFDAYRIDHVLGFFRIWEVPAAHIYGVLGHFRPAMPYSADEIRDFGFAANPKALCQPLLPAEELENTKRTAGEDFEKLYLVKTEGGYAPKPAYRYQREVERLVPEGPARQALLQLLTEVLFVEDPERPGHYHPRVSAQRTRRFAALDGAQQNAFNHLHDHFFYERHNQYWADEAMKKMPVVTRSHDSLTPAISLHPLEGEGMLPCAEDLGMVPASVKGVLDRLRILSLEIQRMPKEYGVRFGNLAHNPYLSVATIATHDMPPFRLWWKENREQTQAFWSNVLGRAGNAPEEATPEVCEEIVSRHIQSPSMLCLLSLQDLLAISPKLRSKRPENEQINVPANPNQYWRYRMHLTIEELIQATDFNEKLRGLIERNK